MYEDLLNAQKEIGAIKKDATNPFFKSNYFDINSLLAVVKPILNQHNFIILQGLTTNEMGVPALSTTLLHTTGKSIEGGVVALPDVADAQKMGGAITYYRRYALQSLLALEAEDDDGNTATGKAKKGYKYPQPEDEGIDIDKPPFEDKPIKKNNDDLL
jgi:hypothetical protein